MRSPGGQRCGRAAPRCPLVDASARYAVAAASTRSRLPTSARLCGSRSSGGSRTAAAGRSVARLPPSASPGRSGSERSSPSAAPAACFPRWPLLVIAAIVGRRGPPRRRLAAVLATEPGSTRCSSRSGRSLARRVTSRSSPAWALAGAAAKVAAATAVGRCARDRQPASGRSRHRPRRRARRNPARHAGERRGRERRRRPRARLAGRRLADGAVGRDRLRRRRAPDRNGRRSRRRARARRPVGAARTSASPSRAVRDRDRRDRVRRDRAPAGRLIPSAVLARRARPARSSSVRAAFGCMARATAGSSAAPSSSRRARCAPEPPAAASDGVNERRWLPPSPVAITVTHTWPLRRSSTVAPKMMFVSSVAAPRTTSAASLTSSSVRSSPPAIESRMPRAPTISVSISGDFSARSAASRARFALSE